MKKNYSYAKLNETGIEYAPNILIVGDKQVINAPAEEYIKQSWLPVERTQQPEAAEGFYFTPYYEEEKGRIVQKWAMNEAPKDDSASEADYINALNELGVEFNE